ncbi:MAG: MOSC domain-containing protein [Oscillatoriales cyanobacterium SM2_2_1]|nr:MOSC domain-containing protein [Oscillatoriales cyanobacterium SM2_2_1]
MGSPSLHSLQVGLPRTLGDPHNPRERPWTTGFYKEAITGPVALSRLNLAGDGQADLTKHGGVDKAVLAYSRDHYPYWQEQIGRVLPYGAFGENLTITNQTEETVCVGDSYRLGTAIIQVSQPRQPCWKLSRRWRRDSLAQEVIANGKTGWYCRVLEEGMMETGQELILLERPLPEWAIARVNYLMHRDRQNLADTWKLVQCPLLSQSWRQQLQKRFPPDKTPP